MRFDANHGDGECDEVGADLDVAVDQGVRRGASELHAGERVANYLAAGEESQVSTEGV